MATKVKEWLKSPEVTKLKNLGLEELTSLYSLRDPIRPQMIDSQYFYTPADGIIVYQKTLNNVNKDLVEVKGNHFTLKELMQTPDFDSPAIVIGIFMTFYDVHINRVPLDGILSYKFLPPIQSTNMPMSFTEKKLLKGFKAYDEHFTDYLKSNERAVVKIYSPILDYTYYIVQIADYDVNGILQFSNEKYEYFTQNERFSVIRWGSQVDLVLPIDKRYRFVLMQKEFTHIEAGVDKVAKIIHKI